MGRRQESGTGRGNLFRNDDHPRRRTHPLVGPASSPKFLYFAQGSTIEPRYIILDAAVAGNLKVAWPGAASGAWLPETYGHYCELMASWPEQATARLHGSQKVRADEIGFAQFKK